MAGVFNYLQNNPDIQRKYPAYTEGGLYTLLEQIFQAVRSDEEGSFNKVSEQIKKAMLIIEEDFHTLKKRYEDF